MGDNSYRVNGRPASGAQFKGLKRTFEEVWHAAGVVSDFHVALSKSWKFACPRNRDEYLRLTHDQVSYVSSGAWNSGVSRKRSAFVRNGKKLPSECKYPPDIVFDTVFRDGELTHREINTLLDLDYDGTVTADDFGMLPVQRSAELFSKIQRTVEPFGYPFEWIVANTLGKYTPSMIRLDKRIMLKAVKLYAPNFKYAHSDLRSDPRFVFKVVSVNGYALKYADPIFRFKKKYVLAAVKSNGHALEFASRELKKDREVVVAAIIQNPKALEYADPTLKEDPSMICLARRGDCAGGA